MIPIYRNNTRLEDHALGLGAAGILLADVNVLPHEQAQHGEGDEASTGNHHLLLNDVVGANDGIALRGVPGVAHLNSNVTIDGGSHVLGRLGETSSQLTREDVGPDTASDGKTDSSSDGTKHTPQSEGDSDILVVDRGHDGETSSQGPDTTVDTVEELTHDEPVDSGVGVTEVDEQGSTEDHEGDADEGRPLEVSEVSNSAAKVSCCSLLVRRGDSQSDKGTNKGGHQGERVENVTRSGDALEVNNLQVRSVVTIPAAGTS